MAPPAPFMIDYSIEAIYRDKGWYPDTINDGITLPYPTMQELYDKLEVEVEKTDYEGEIKGNLKSILQVRIGSLLRREMGDVFNVAKSSFAPEEWLQKPALIELEAMGSGPSNFLSLLLTTLIRESLKITPNAGGRELRHVIFFEEAHNLIGPVAQEITGEDADPKMAATAYVVKMLAEVRALKEGIVIADQLPTAMAPEVIKNTGLKIGHRITAEDDRELLGGTMSATETQLEQMQRSCQVKHLLLLKDYCDHSRLKCVSGKMEWHQLIRHPIRSYVIFCGKQKDIRVFYHVVQALYVESMRVNLKNFVIKHSIFFL